MKAISIIGYFLAILLLVGVIVDFIKSKKKNND